jgi:FMN phosphatase YigB (HAD superfamily)
MSIKAVLFDLDGTLLPMDQDVFLKSYLESLSKKLAPAGYDPKALVSAIWQGTGAMINNNGDTTNEAAFWNEFSKLFGKDSVKDIPIFEDFYRNEFQNVRDVCGYTPESAKLVRELKEKGIRVALATNPIFPEIATVSRVRWAGLNIDEFELYTTYENSIHCKPNPEYYRDILRQMKLEAEEALMVGNDVSDDMSAEKLGMKVFLLTDCLINRKGVDISIYPNGNIKDLLKILC